MFLYTLLLSLILPTFNPPAPIQVVDTEPFNLSGYWAGHITQDKEDGAFSSFDIELYLKDDNGTLSGTTITNDGEIHAHIDVEGTFKSGLSIFLRDTEIKDNKVKTDVRMEWCLKQYILLLKKIDDEWVLEGHWHGKTSFMTCTPGKVVLKKGVERA